MVRMPESEQAEGPETQARGTGVQKCQGCCRSLGSGQLCPERFQSKMLVFHTLLRRRNGAESKDSVQNNLGALWGPCHPRTPHRGQSILHPVLLVQALDMNVADGASGFCVPRLLAAHTAELGAGLWAPDGQEDCQSQVQRNFRKADPGPGGSVPGQSPGMYLLGSRRCGHLWVAL